MHILCVVFKNENKKCVLLPFCQDARCDLQWKDGIFTLPWPQPSRTYLARRIPGKTHFPSTMSYYLIISCNSSPFSNICALSRYYNSTNLLARPYSITSNFALFRICTIYLELSVWTRSLYRQIINLQTSAKISSIPVSICPVLAPQIRFTISGALCMFYVCMYACMYMYVCMYVLLFVLV